MGRKAVGTVCCVMHVKEPGTLIVKEKGLAPVFLDWCLEHPAGWICARYKSYHYYFYYYYYRKLKINTISGGCLRLFFPTNPLQAPKSRIIDAFSMSCFERFD